MNGMITKILANKLNQYYKDSPDVVTIEASYHLSFEPRIRNITLKKLPLCILTSISTSIYLIIQGYEKYIEDKIEYLH